MSAITVTTAARVRETRMKRTDRSPYSGWFQRRLLVERVTLLSGTRSPGHARLRIPPKGDPCASANRGRPVPQARGVWVVISTFGPLRAGAELVAVLQMRLHGGR